MQNLYRCRICGEVYYGTHPSHCPYCGAHSSYLIGIENWKDENLGLELTKQEAADIAETKRLEYDNTRFYRAASKNSQNDEIKGFFKYLARIESEHYDITCKLLGDEKDSKIMEPSTDLGSDILNLERSKENEKHVAELYAVFAKRSQNNRVKQLFVALSEIESDHIELDNGEIIKARDVDI